jgi:hypothetical protein
MTETTQSIQLVEGTFSPIEAADVLFSLITDKIKFHNLQLLNVNELSNDTITHSEQRIRALKEAKNLVKDLILKARNQGYELEIDSTIEIRLKQIDYPI